MRRHALSLAGAVLLVLLAVSGTRYLDGQSAGATRQPGAAPASARLMSDDPSGSEVAATEDDENRAEIAALRRDVERLAAQLAQLKANQGAVTSAAMPFPEAVGDDDFRNDELDSPEDSVFRSKENVRRHFESIETAFNSEPIDQQWSVQMSARIGDAFASIEDLGALELDVLDCRAGRCRLEVSFSDGFNMESAQAQLAFAVSDELSRMAVNYENDQVTGLPYRAVIYLGQEEFQGAEE